MCVSQNWWFGQDNHFHSQEKRVSSNVTIFLHQTSVLNLTANGLGVFQKAKQYKDIIWQTNANCILSVDWCHQLCFVTQLKHTSDQAASAWLCKVCEVKQTPFDGVTLGSSNFYGPNLHKVKNIWGTGKLVRAPAYTRGHNRYFDCQSVPCFRDQYQIGRIHSSLVQALFLRHNPILEAQRRLRKESRQSFASKILILSARRSNKLT